MKLVYIQDRISGVIDTAEYKETKAGHLRYHVNGKVVADKTFDKKYIICPPPPAPFEQVNTGKEFYSYAPQSTQNEKFYRKLFSIARSVFATVYVTTDGRFKFSRFYQSMDVEVYFESRFVNIAAYAKPKIGFTFNSIKCLSTGYKLVGSEDIKKNESFRFDAVLDADGKCFSGNFKNYTAIPWSEMKGISSLGTKSAIQRNYFVTGGREGFTEPIKGYYSTFLILQDFLWFKKGQIFDARCDYWYWHEPTRLPNQKNHSIYKVNETISCDLNKITIEELESLFVKDTWCGKREFGCQHGCTTECYRESSKRIDNKTIQLYIDIKKRLGI